MEQKNNQKPTLSWSTPAAKPVSALVKAPSTIVPPQSTKQSTLPTNVSNGHIARYVGVFVAGVIIGVLGMWGWSSRDGGQPVSTSTSTEQSVNNAAASIHTSKAAGPLTVPTPQKAGTTVTVANLNTDKQVWVVVYEDREGAPGNVLGAKLFFSTGGGTVTLLRGTVAGRNYFVGVSTDNGDRKYSMAGDTAIKNTDGSLLVVSFKAQ